MPDLIGTVAYPRPTSGNRVASFLIGKRSSDDDLLAPGIDAPGTGSRPPGENNEDGSGDDRSLSCSLVASGCRIHANGHTISVSVANVFVRYPDASVRRLAICAYSVAVYVSGFRIGETG